MRAYGLSERSIRSYRGAIDGSLSSWAIENNITSKPIPTIQTPEQFNQVSSKIQRLKIFKSRDSKGKGMYRNALNRYSDYLSETALTNIEGDIRSNPEIKGTEKISLIQARLGQGKFRERLIKLWGHCSVSGYTNPALLIASHIKPWAKATNEERLDKYNGLLLTPNLDKAFDKGLITFDEHGKVIISKSLTEPRDLGIHPNLQIAPFHKKTKNYMLYHRNSIFSE